MGFKLGTKPYARDFKNKGTELNILTKNLEKGVNAEAVDANTIVIDDSIPKGSKLWNEAVAHEKHHADEMKSGRIGYGDDWVRSDGKTYPRKDGKIKYNGKWYIEGHKDLPWEKRAIKAEKKT